MRKLIYPILILLVVIGTYYINGELDIKQQQENLEQDNDGVSDVPAATGMPAFVRKKLLPSSTTDAIVHHNTYSLSYVEKHEQAEWVAYVLRDTDTKGRDYKRPYFEKDPYVKTESAEWWNYKKSGYDKGHLCPAGDRKSTKAAYEETFLTSNISPQLHAFNAGIWNTLEQKVRYWAGRYETVFVITGGVLKPGLKGIGDQEVSVPEQFYKIVMRYENGEPRVLAFVMPNKRGDKNLYEYLTTVDEVEKLTGLDFFASFPDAIENKIERENQARSWAKINQN